MPPQVILDSDDEGLSDESPFQTPASTKITSQSGRQDDSLENSERNTSDGSPSPGWTGEPQDLSKAADSLPTSLMSARQVRTTYEHAGWNTTMDQVGMKRQIAQEMYGAGNVSAALSGERGDMNSSQPAEDEIDLLCRGNGQLHENVVSSQRDSLSKEVSQNPAASTPSNPQTPVMRGARRNDGSMDLPSQPTAVSATLSQVVDGALEDLQTWPIERTKSEETPDKQSAENGDYACEAETDAKSEISMQTPKFEENQQILFLNKNKEEEPRQDYKEHQDTSISLSSDLLESKSDVRDKPPQDLRDKKRSKEEGLSTLSEKKTPKRRLDSSEDELGSNDRGVEVPKESYKPRPSRSRRGGLPEDFMASIDFSSRPERPSKRKSKLKRNKTTGDLPPTTIESEEEEKEGVTGDEIRQAIPAEKSEEEDQLEIDVNDEKALVQKGKVEPKKRKRGRPKKQTAKEEEEMAAADDVRPTETSAEVQISDAPTSKKRGRKKKEPQGASAAGKQSEGDEMDKSPSPNRLSRGDDESEDSEDEARKKNGKKRKLRVHVDKEDEEDEKGSQQSESKSAGGSALQERTASPNAAATAQPTKGKVEEAEDKSTRKEEEEEASGPSQARAENTPVKAKAGAGLGKMSPANGGSTRYRVGLSRKARIEPLLRVVRK